MRPVRRLSATLTVALVALSLLATPSASASAPASPEAAGTAAPTSAAPSAVRMANPDDISFTGHGWGHGRGMGQYGALGYAVNHGWSYAQILDHFYGGTTLGTVPGLDANGVSVELEALNAPQELRAIGKNLVVNGAARPAGVSSVRVTWSAAAGAFLIEVAATCAAPGAQTWTAIGHAATVSIGTGSQATYDDLVRVCEPTGERGYRGTLSVQRHLSTGAQTTFNHTTLQNYLFGVVPRESPDAWGSLANGMAALKAQAVAARSYAVSSAYRPSGARMCDTTSCQVYGGATWQAWGGGRAILDGTNAVQAVLQTDSQVRFKTGTGTTARTEFSSSTGGWTVGGAFPAVQDLGDSIASNPNHVWNATFTAGEVAAKLGISGLRSITVTARNGLGDWGGRVTQVSVVDGGGVTRTFSGTDFRSKLGTDRFKSDWFIVSMVSRADAESVVKALYQDLLLRAPDPTGLKGWTDALLTGTSQSVLVSTLTSSREYIQLRVAKAYTEVLGRAPDQQGADDWLRAIQAGQGTVDDVQRRFYDSQEYFTASGNTQDGYVRRLYTTMLRREAGQSEVDNWVAIMNARGRGYVVDSIWFSMEAASVRAGDYYLVFLGRAPDPEGQRAWAQVLLSHGEGAVRNGIAGSNEYKQRAIARFP